MVSGNVPAAIPARNTTAARPNNEHSSPRDYAGFDPSVGTGSNPGARTVSQLALEPPRTKGKVSVLELSLSRRALPNLGLKMTTHFASRAPWTLCDVGCRFATCTGPEQPQKNFRALPQSSFSLPSCFRSGRKAHYDCGHHGSIFPSALSALAVLQ
jgi:hypothetical protein